MQNLNVRLLALVLALSAVTVGTTWAAPAAQDDEGVIEGYVFLDSDGDGELDLDEPGIEGLTLRLEGELEKSTKTDLAGGYGFSKLPDGDYTVTVEPGEDYATAELDSLEVTIEDGDVTSNVNFGLREASDTAEDLAAADDTSADTTEGSTADATSDDTTDADATDAADEADAADAEPAAVDAAAINALVQQMIDGMGEDASEAEVRAAFEQALVAARAEGTEDEMNAAIDQALASMASQDAANDDADAASDSTDDEADTSADDADEAMADAAATQDDAAETEDIDDLPATGAGGPIGIGMLVVLVLALVGGLGRTMERRQSV